MKKRRYRDGNAFLNIISKCLSALILHPYIEGATALSDEELQEFPFFCRVAEMDFQRLAGPRNVSVDLKYMFCACECLYGIPT